MKENSKKHIILAILTCSLWLTSCSDFLEESDPSNFTVDNYFTKPAHAVSSVNAAYAQLRDPYPSGFGGAPWYMLEFATGLAATDLGQAVDSYFVKDLNNVTNNSYGRTFWTSYYRGIANANLSIQKIPGITMNETEKKKLLGEAYFLRAFYYFNLVRIFGNIPLINEPISLQSEQLRPKAASAEVVYALIVSDLKTAESAGLPWKDVTGRVSTGAVKSLLAKVYLTMAGFPLKKGNEYFDLSAKKAEEVIVSNQYKLFSTYSDLHDASKKNLDENIFMVQYKSGIINSSWQEGIVPYNKNISAYSSETGGIYSNPDFIGAYDSDDLRIKEKQFFYSTFTNESDRSKEVKLGGYFIWKLFDIPAQTSTQQSDLNWSLIRYADILLTFAEASNEVGGPSPKVLESVNAIRKRAQLPDLAGLSKEELREAIWRERWYELCFENQTWFDMVRLRKGLNLKTKKFDEYVGYKFTYLPSKAVSQRELLFPIPADEVLNNPNLAQNEGYK